MILSKITVELWLNQSNMYTACCGGFSESFQNRFIVFFDSKAKRKLYRSKLNNKPISLNDFINAVQQRYMHENSSN